jgi:hypothetical protein
MKNRTRDTEKLELERLKRIELREHENKDEIGILKFEKNLKLSHIHDPKYFKMRETVISELTECKLNVNTSKQSLTGNSENSFPDFASSSFSVFLSAI